MILSELLLSIGAGDSASIPFPDCRILDHNKLDRFGFQPKSVCLGIIPYYSHSCDEFRTVSAYAVAKDYHLYVRNLSSSIETFFCKYHPEDKFRICTDNSPIDEVDSAARAGLGIIGRNHLLITPKFSSFVFIFEIFSTLAPEKKTVEPLFCENCGKCLSACPIGMSSPDECISSITQKKGELSEKEIDLIRRFKTVWGCDICQLACPHTCKARQDGSLYTENSWFTSDIVKCPTAEQINNRSFFKYRAYSWRGPQPILRNIAILSGRSEKKTK